ncbi:hypothetical protein L6R50_09215 [Myxococcota bacterium]|nr:hypothetical protein [Myxococcota bacterium]
MICGEAAAAGLAGRRATYLNLGGPKPSLHLEVQDVAPTAVDALPDVVADLVEVACYLFGADQSCPPRIGPGSERIEVERQRVRVLVPVRRSDLWSSAPVMGALTEFLEIVFGDDNYRVEFRDLPDARPLSQYVRTASTPLGEVEADEVIVFTGDLASLEATLVAVRDRGVRAVLVDQRTTPRIDERHRTLARELASRCPPGQVRYVPAWVTAGRARDDGRPCRSRPLLIVALGVLLARVAGCLAIGIPAAGLLSLGLAFGEGDAVTSAAHPAHPLVVAALRRLFSALLPGLVELEVRSRWRTPADQVRSIRDHGCVDLIRHTLSCPRPPASARGCTHCGECVACFDRRFATLASGVADDDPVSLYAVDPLTGHHSSEGHRTLVETYYRQAAETARTSAPEYFARHPEANHVVRHLPGPADHAASMVLDLVARQAGDVVAVVEAALHEHLGALLAGSLPPDCLLAMAIPDAYRAREGPPEPLAPVVEGKHQLTIVDSAATLDGVEVVGADHPQWVAVLRFFVRRWAESVYRRDPEGQHEFWGVEAILADLRRVEHVETADPETIRKYVARLRDRLRDAYVVATGRVLDPNEVVETAPDRRGYRLNPETVVVVLPPLPRAPPDQTAPGATSTGSGGQGAPAPGRRARSNRNRST